MHIAIFSTSFRDPSLTQATALEVASRVTSDHEVSFIDAATLPALPLVGCELSGTGAAVVASIEATLAAADAVIIGAPLYRASVSGAAKALVDYFGDHLAGKPVGVFVAAGGPGGYLAVSDLDRPLALDLSCPIAPGRLLVTGGADPEDARRIDEFVTGFERFATRSALEGAFSA